MIQAESSKVAQTKRRAGGVNLREGAETGHEPREWGPGGHRPVRGSPTDSSKKASESGRVCRASRVLRGLTRPHGLGLQSPSLLNSLEASAALSSQGDQRPCASSVWASTLPNPLLASCLCFQSFPIDPQTLPHSFSGIHDILITSLQQPGPSPPPSSSNTGRPPSPCWPCQEMNTRTPITRLVQ